MTFSLLNEPIHSVFSCAHVAIFGALGFRGSEEKTLSPLLILALV